MRDARLATERAKAAEKRENALILKIKDLEAQVIPLLKLRGYE